MSGLDKAAEAIIQEAMARGGFQNLPGQGKPIDLSAYFDTPEELRAAYSILKNAGILPREAELLKEIAELKESLAGAQEERRRAELRRQIERKQVEFRLMMERNQRREK